MPSIKSNETQIQSTIIDYLYLKKHFFVRLNNIPPVQHVNGKMVFRKMPKGSVKGLPDIMLITDGGYVVFLEVKDKSKQSPDQKEFERRCKEKGSEYYIVKSLEDVKNIGL